MKHLREKIQFPCFQFHKVVRSTNQVRWENMASFDCLLS